MSAKSGEKGRVTRGSADPSALGLANAVSPQELLDASPWPLLFADTAGVIRAANPSATQLFGFAAAEELIGRSIFGLLVAGDLDRGRADFEVVLREGLLPETDYQLLRQDGSAFWAELTAATIVDDAGKLLGVMATGHDITLRKKAEKQARESEACFRTIFEESRDGLILADPQTLTFIQANDAACRLLGYSRAEFGQLGLPQIHPPESVEEIAQVFADQRDGKLELATDLPVLCKDGTVLRVDICQSQMVIGGKPFVLGHFRDVTERTQLRARIAQTDRLSSASLLAAGLAHELNNPLTYVLGNLEALLAESQQQKKGEELDKETEQRLAWVQKRLNIALLGSRRIRDVVSDLNHFTREAREPGQPLDINQLLIWVCRMVKSEFRERATLTQELGDLPKVAVNEGRLSQVFLNLLLNAVQSFDADDPQANVVAVRSWSEQDTIEVAISDTGVGISAACLNRVLDPFYTTKGGAGSGLGLTISRHIVEDMNGALQVDSEEGKGTTVRVSLPICSKLGAAAAS